MGWEYEQVNDQQPRDEAAVAAFVERFAADLIEAGMARMPARIFACLMASEEGVLSAAEIGRRLQVSPAAVSGGVRYLANVHMVSREREPGSRRERYRLHQQVWFAALVHREPIIERWSASMRAGVEVVGPGTPAAERLAETADFMFFLQEELSGMLDRWRERKRTGTGAGTGTD
ncbi:MarR family transcriptional regulator [Streptomyces xiamenensis]|uniref:GbsR/MarR family transcriptional regulator n=1 Tax=Streptomyces xiamenensis TaxID=408015 RepID=UPI003442CD80